MCKNYPCSIWITCYFKNYSIILFRQKSTEYVSFEGQWCFALLYQLNENLQFPSDQNRNTWKNAAAGKFILLILFWTWSICWCWTWLKFISDVLQCWICNTQRLSSVVIFAFQKKLHAVTVSQRNFNSWLGSESDGGCDCNWKNRCAFLTGNENLIGFYHCNSLLRSYVSSWLSDSCVLINSRG